MPKSRRTRKNEIRARIFGEFIQAEIAGRAKTTEKTFAKFARGEIPPAGLTPGYHKEDLKKFATTNYNWIKREEKELEEAAQREEEQKKLTAGKKKISIEEYRKRYQQN